MANLPTSIKEFGLNTLDNFPMYQEIKDMLTNNLKQLPNWKEIDRTFNQAGTLELILHLISVSGQINSFLNLRGVQERYLEFAQLDESIYSKARELGYRINRFSAPIIEIEYTGIPTIEIKMGEVFGYYEANDKVYELIYFGDTKLIENSDKILVKVGKYVEKSFKFDINYEEPVINLLKPEFLHSVDNTSLELFFDGEKQVKTIFPEDYVVYRQYVDYSESITDAKIFVVDFGLSHGLYETFQDSPTRTYDIKYIETDRKFFSLNINDLDMADNWRAVGVDSLGVDSDSKSDIIKNAPLVYSVMRRSVTEADFIFLIESMPWIKSASVTPFGGIDGIYDVKIQEQNVTNWININSTAYSYQNLEGLSNDIVTELLYRQVRNDPNINSEILYTPDGNILRLHTKSPRIPMNIVTSSNMELYTIRPQNRTVPCVIHVRYVGYQTDEDIIPITYGEYKDMEKLINFYKPVGLTIYYEHADKFNIDLSYSIILSDFADKALVEDIVEQVIESYNFRVNIEVDSKHIANTIRLYANSKFNQPLIREIFDSKPFNKYVDKTKFTKINWKVSYN